MLIQISPFCFWWLLIFLCRFLMSNELSKETNLESRSGSFFSPDSGLDWKIPNNNFWHICSLLLVFFRGSSKYILFRYANTIPILISGRYPAVKFKLNGLVWKILWTKSFSVYAYNDFRNGSLQNKTPNLNFCLTVTYFYSDVTTEIFLSVGKIFCSKQSCFSEGPLEKGELIFQTEGSFLFCGFRILLHRFLNCLYC